MKILLLIPLLLFTCTGEQPTGNTDVQKSASIPQKSDVTTPTDSTIDYSLTNPIPMENTFVDSASVPQKQELPTSINYTPKGQYTSLKARAKVRQAHYKAAALGDTLISDSLLASARKEITDLLLQEVFPFWYGTEWDFNGYTAVPQKGEIACGYLVSTTLRDVGFRLNRYHMAQQASYYAAVSLQKKAALKIYRDLSPTKLKYTLINELKAKPGLYFIGLDNHVGYLLIHQEELYFIHSNYLTDQVMIQRAEDSFAFGSTIYVIADITHNDALISKWVRGEVIPIKRG